MSLLEAIAGRFKNRAPSPLCGGRDAKHRRCISRAIKSTALNRALEALTPPQEMSLSQWIEASIVLPASLTAVPGAMRLYPYQKQIADCIGDAELERVTLVKAARIGFSVLVAAAIGHFCSNDPAPVICLLPVELDCHLHSRHLENFSEMFAEKGSA